MNNWDLTAVDAPPHHPLIVSTTEEGRAIVISLPAGERMQEHEVHERAWLVVVSGEVQVSPDGVGEAVRAGPGAMFEFAPGERREILAHTDARLLFLLTPWPGEGHPGAMTLDQKERAREAAAEHARR